MFERQRSRASHHRQKSMSWSTCLICKREPASMCCNVLKHLDKKKKENEMQRIKRRKQYLLFHLRNILIVRLDSPQANVKSYNLFQISFYLVIRRSLSRVGGGVISAHVQRNIATLTTKASLFYFSLCKRKIFSLKKKSCDPACLFSFNILYKLRSNVYRKAQRY